MILSFKVIYQKFWNLTRGNKIKLLREKIFILTVLCQISYYSVRREKNILSFLIILTL